MSSAPRDLSPRTAGAGVVFDPTLCPLLDGLTPEEQAERMECDPVISACVRRLEGGADQNSSCSVRRAYGKRALARG